MFICINYCINPIINITMCYIGEPLIYVQLLPIIARCLIPYLWLSNTLMIANRTGRALYLNTEIIIIIIYLLIT